MGKDKSVNELSEMELLQQAVNASSEGITISIMDQPDRPLIFVNEGFEKLTGYHRDYVVGKNCRFLQGQGTDPMSVTELREAIKNGKPCTVELLNYRESGEPFWNRLSITPIHNQYGKVTHYVGIQSDITDLRDTQDKLRRANKKLQIFRDRIMKELEQAKTVQQFLLPTKLPFTPHVRFSALFEPMEKIGGDLFDVIELSDHHYGILIADVTGHGIPAALLTFMLSTVFKNIAPRSFSPAETIKLTNERLHGKMPGDSFVTMFYAVYDVSTKKLTYTQAGHPEAFIIRNNRKEVVALESAGTLVGPFSNKEVSFTEEEIQLDQGDKLVLYTDAILDRLDTIKGAPVERDLKVLLLENSNMPLDQLFTRMYQYGLDIHQLEKYPDDFTMLGMELM